MQETSETLIPSLGQENPLEKGMATYFSVIVWRIPQSEDPGRLWSKGSHKVIHNWRDLAYMHNATSKEVSKLYTCYVYERATDKRGHRNVLNSKKKNTDIKKNTSDDTTKYKWWKIHSSKMKQTSENDRDKDQTYFHICKLK